MSKISCQRFEEPRRKKVSMEISLSNMNASNYFASAIVTTVIGMDWNHNL